MITRTIILILISFSLVGCGTLNKVFSKKEIKQEIERAIEVNRITGEVITTTRKAILPGSEIEEIRELSGGQDSIVLEDENQKVTVVVLPKMKQIKIKAVAKPKVVDEIKVEKREIKEARKEDVKEKRQEETKEKTKHREQWQPPIGWIVFLFIVVIVAVLVLRFLRKRII